MRRIDAGTSFPQEGDCSDGLEILKAGDAGTPGRTKDHNFGNLPSLAVHSTRHV